MTRTVKIEPQGTRVLSGVVRINMEKSKLVKLGLMALPLFIPILIFLYTWLNPSIGWDAYTGRGNILIFLVIVTVVYCKKLIEEIMDAVNSGRLCDENLSEADSGHQYEITGEKKTFEYSPLRKKITEFFIFAITVPIPIALAIHFWDIVMRSDLEFKIICISMFFAVILIGVILYVAQKNCIETTLTIHDGGIEQSFGNGKITRIAFRDLKAIAYDDRNKVYILKTLKEKMVVRKVYQNSDALFELIDSWFTNTSETS
jgi:hypothetical protein